MAKLGGSLRGRVWKFGDSIDTNMLAGGGIQVSNDPRDNLKANCLRGVRPEFPEQVQAGDIIVAGRNWGCGSHRQTAVEALQICGVAAVVAESVARIHMRNCIASAMPTFVAPGVSEIVNDGEQLELDYTAGVVRNVATGAQVALRKFPQNVEQIYEAGGLVQVIAERLAREGIVPAAPAANS